MEIVDYATYDSATVMFDVMGFGKPLDELPMLLQPGVLSLAWGSVVRQLAAGLGIELDEVSETYIREPAPEDFEIAAGHIPKGSAAALRFEVRGMKGGKPAVVLEHVTRLRDDLRPDWPQPAQEGGSYRVEVTGRAVLRVGPLSEQSKRRSQPRRIGRYRRPCRQRDPRRCRGRAGNQDDVGLAPDYRKRAVRWLITRGFNDKEGLCLCGASCAIRARSSSRQAPQRQFFPRPPPVADPGDSSTLPSCTDVGGPTAMGGWHHRMRHTRRRSTQRHAARTGLPAIRGMTSSTVPR